MSRLARNIVANVMAQGLVMALGFAAARSLVRGVGEDAFGVIYFMLALNTMLIGALDMGMGFAIVREVSLAVGEEKDYAARLARTAALIYGGLTVLSAALLVLGAPAIVDGWLRVSADLRSDAIWVIRVLSLSTVCGFARNLYASVLRGAQRIELTSRLDVAGALVQQVGILAVFGLGGGLRAVVGWLALSSSLPAVLHAAAVARLLGRGALVPGFEREVLRRTWGYARRMALISALSAVHGQADRLLVSRLLSVATFGHYGFGYSVVSRIGSFTNAVTQAAFPSLATLSSGSSRERFLAQYWKLQDFVCYSTGPLFGIVPFLALPLLGLVFTPEVARTLLVPISLLAFGFYLNGTLQVPYMVILATGRLDIALRWAVVGLVVVLPSTTALVWSLGLTGAGLAWVLYQLASATYTIPLFCRFCLGVPPRAWYAHAVRPVTLLLGAYGGAWMALGLFGDPGLGALAFAYLAATAVFAAVATTLVGEELRDVARRILTRGTERE